MKLSKRLDDLETQQALTAGYWVRLKSDCKQRQTPESVIADYDAANGFDPARNYIVRDVVYPKDSTICA